MGNIKIHIYNCKKKEYEYPCCVYPGQIIKINKWNESVEIAASDGVIVVDSVVIDGEEYEAGKILKSTRIRLNYCLQEEIFKLRVRLEMLEKLLSEKLS